MKFEDKIVLITGGSRGIGRETAMIFAQEGAQVIINFHSDQQAAETTLRSLSGTGHMMIKADIGSPDELEGMVGTIMDTYDHIDILVNNAGVFFDHRIDETPFDEWLSAWEKIISINLLGVAHLSYLVGQVMIKQNSGAIINISSRGAFRGEPESPAYGASKGGVNSLSQSLARALGKYNISVTAVAPGFVETDMAKSALSSEKGDFIRSESPMNRVATPQEVARIVAFLAEEESKFMTGGIIDINGASFLRM